MNFFSNSLGATFLIYASVIILETSGDILDILLNSVAIFFLIDLDDLFITSSDEEILLNTLTYTFIDILHELGVSYKPNKHRITTCILMEKAIIIILGIVNIASFAYSIYSFCKMEDVA